MASACCSLLQATWTARPLRRLGESRTHARHVVLHHGIRRRSRRRGDALCPAHSWQVAFVRGLPAVPRAHPTHACCSPIVPGTRQAGRGNHEDDARGWGAQPARRFFRFSSRRARRHRRRRGRRREGTTRSITSLLRLPPSAPSPSRLSFPSPDRDARPHAFASRGIITFCSTRRKTNSLFRGGPASCGAVTRR